MDRILLTIALCTVSTASKYFQHSTQPEVYSLHVQSNIRYRYAHTLVSSRVANHANVSQEVSFSMVIPETAFISGFVMEVDGKSYKASVKEKDEAKKEYTAAVQEGRMAGHMALSARDSNRFTVSVNVEAQKKMTFNLTYEELLTRKLGQYNHIINLDPGQIVRDFSIEVHLEESSNITSLIVPALRTSNEIVADPAGTNNSLVKIEYLDCRTAVIKYAPNEEEQKNLAHEGLKGQLIVQYDVNRSSVHPSELLVNDGYFAHYFAPEHLKPLPKHVIFVLDTSGSMAGHKLRQLKDAMNTILGDLRPEDYFSLVCFSTRVKVWHHTEVAQWRHSGVEEAHGANSMMSATSHKIKKAKLAIRELHADGGTNIHQAMKISVHLASLGKKLSTGKSKPENTVTLEPIIIFLTDGDPTDGITDCDTIIIDTSNWNRKSRASIFSLALGEDADLEFLEKLSLRNSGFSQKIYQASDTALQLRDFYRQVATPLVANVTFRYQAQQVETKSLTQNHFPSFYSGSELVVAGHLDQATPGQELSYEVTGRTPEGLTHFMFDHPVIIVDNANQPGFLERLWAYLSIQQLLNEEKKAYGKSSADKKKEAIQIALKYSFVTPVTSLVMVKPDGDNARTDTEPADKITPSDYDEDMYEKRNPSTNLRSIGASLFDDYDSYDDYDDDDPDVNYMPVGSQDLNNVVHDKYLSGVKHRPKALKEPREESTLAISNGSGSQSIGSSSSFRYILLLAFVKCLQIFVD